MNFTPAGIGVPGVNGPMANRGDKRRQKLRAMLANADMDATTLARRIGRDKSYVTDYLSGIRKKDIGADDWDAIVDLLGDPDANDKLAADDVRAAVEPLLQWIAGSPEAAQYAVEALLEVLKGRQSLPPGVTRDAAIRLLAHNITVQLAAKSSPAKH